MSKLKTLIWTIRGGRILKVLASKIVDNPQEVVKQNRVNYWTNLMRQRCESLQDRHLSENETQRISTYWGERTNTIFHQFYKSATGHFDVRLIPNDIYYTQIDPYFNDWSEGVCLDNKIYYRFYFPFLKQPVIIGFRWNGYWYDGNSNQISIRDIIESISSKAIACFVKAASCSMGGHGVKFVNGSEMSINQIGEIIESFDGDIIIQEKIIQNEAIARLNKSSVNTVRIMTFLRKDGSVKTCSSCLRMGLAGSVVDNASSGGITVGIEPATGKLKETAYSPSGRSYSKHPTSGTKFSDIVIPNFSKIIECAERGAVSMPKFRLISWDFAIDSNNEPILIEANLFVGELEFHQLNNGPIFGDETDEILKEVALNPKEICYPF